MSGLIAPSYTTFFTANGECSIAWNDKGIANLKTYLTQRGSGFAASMLGDLEKGGAIEGRHVIGDMLGRARKHGITAPHLRTAYAVVQAYEARRDRGGLGTATK